MSRRTALISGVLLMTLATTLMNATQSTPWSFDGTRPLKLERDPEFKRLQAALGLPEE